MLCILVLCDVMFYLDMCINSAVTHHSLQALWIVLMMTAINWTITCTSNVPYHITFYNILPYIFAHLPSGAKRSVSLGTCTFEFKIVTFPRYQQVALLL